MDNGASSYRRFRDEGDMEGLAEIIRDYKEKGSPCGLPFYFKFEFTNSLIWSSIYFFCF